MALSMGLFSIVLAALLGSAPGGQPDATAAGAVADIVSARASGNSTASVSVPSGRLPKGAGNLVLSFDLTPETVVPDEAFLVDIAVRAGTMREGLATLGLYPPPQPGRRQDFAVPVPDRLIAAARAGGRLTIEVRLVPLAPNDAAAKPPQSVLIVGNPTLSAQ
jgi:hypothetical protein